MDDETRAEMAKINAKLDTLIANDTDEQVAGLLGKINALLAHPVVRGVLVPAGIVCAIGWLGKSGYLTQAQQETAAEVVIAAAGSTASAPQPAAAPAPVVAESAVPVALPADGPAPMAPTE